MNKLNAYTVMEMIVVMLLGGIVISIAFTSFRILSTQYNNYQKSNEEIAKIALLNKLIAKDISEAEIVVRNHEGFECRGNRKTVFYKIGDNYIVRNFLITDTFVVKPYEISYTFLNEQQEIPELPVDQIEFKGILREEEFFFSYQKKYGADILMEYGSR